MNLNNNKFTLTCDKTFGDFERALLSLAQNGPVLMSQVRPLLSRDGFDWVGSQTEGIKQTRLLDVRYDNRYPTPVDFLVLKQRKDDTEYLSRNPRFDLGERPDNNKEVRPIATPKAEMNSRTSQNILSRIWRMFIYVLTFGRSVENRHVNHVDWNRKLKVLEKGDTVPCIEYRDDRETFTASDFLNGDQDAMIVRRQGTYITVERREVKSLRLVRKADRPIQQNVSHFTFQRTGNGRIEEWHDDKQYGFLRNEKNKERFWFSINTILDERLKRSLNSGKYGQTVRYSVVRESISGQKRDAVVQILEMTKDYEIDRKYKAGHDAMIAGDLDLASLRLKDVIQDKSSESRLSAIKDLAEVYNRQGTPQKSLELIEDVRRDFPSSAVQASFNMMEINYLERLSRWGEALDKVQKLLRGEMPENRRLHFDRKRQRLENLVLGTSGELQDVAVDEASNLIAKHIKEMGIVSKTIDELKARFVDERESDADEYQVVKVIILKLNDYLSARTWGEKESIVDSIVTQMEGVITLPRDICDAINDALQNDLLNSIASNKKSGLEIDGRGMEKTSSDSVTLKFDISLPNQSSIPLKNIMIALDDNHESESIPRDELTFDDGRVGVEMPFRLSKEEIDTGNVAITVRVSYDLNVNEDIIENLDDEMIHGVVEKKLSSGLDKTKFTRIFPNPFTEYCNHIAKGNYFVGREELMDEICTYVASPAGTTGQAYLLYGQARSGKSSIRENLRNKLRTIGNGRIFYTEVSVHAWSEHMLEKQPLEFLVYDLLVSVRGKLREIKAWTDEVKAEYAEIPSDYHAKKIEFLGERLRDHGFLWVVVIDEFTDLYDILITSAKDSFVNNRILDFLRVLKGVLESQHPAFNLLLIGQDSMPLFKKRFWNKLSVSKEKRVSYLDKAPTQQLLQKPIENQVKVSSEALDLYYDYVGGYPLYAMYFCARVVDYVNMAQEPISIIGCDDINKIADSFCKGDNKFRPDEFDPFVQLEMPDVVGEDLMAIYYALARQNLHAILWDVPDEVRKRRIKLIDELRKRYVIQENPDRTEKLRMGLFAKYLYENPGLTIEDLRSAKGWYHD